MSKTMFNNGDRVKWTYRHCLGRSYVHLTREGVFIGLVKHRKTPITQMAKVLFDYNKSVSIIPLCEVRPVTITGEEE